MIYVQKGRHQTEVTLKKRSPVEWLRYAHELQTIIDPEDLPEFINAGAYLYMASGFGERHDVKEPPLASNTISKEALPLRKFITIEYTNLDKDLEKAVLSQIQTLFDEYAYALYPGPLYPKERNWIFTLEISNYLVNKEYKEAVRGIINDIGYPAEHPNNLKSFDLKIGPIYTDSKSKELSIFHNGIPYDIDQYIENTPESDTEASESNDSNNQDPSTPIREDALQRALEAFKDNSDVKHQIAHDREYVPALIQSLALAVVDNTITNAFAVETLSYVDHPNATEQALQEAVQYLTETPAEQHLVSPITSFIPVAMQFNAQNLAELFNNMLPKGHIPDPKMTPDLVAETIARFFEFALLPNRNTSDADNVAIFNPLTGAWEHDEDEFISMMTVIKPGITNMQVRTVMMMWGATARRRGAVINPYNGTGFLLFENGALHIRTLTLHPFTDPIIKKNQFTKRHKISMKWNPAPKLKVFPNDRPDGGEWTIDRFIGGYSYNKPHLTEYFLFGLSLGLFAGHNTSVHFDIQGKSRLGKTTLARIFDNLFQGRIAIMTYNQINSPFPLTSYDPDTAVIWIKECNIGSQPMSDEYGTPFYDGLADAQVRLSVKHGGDIIIDNPPQLFIDGTQFIQATEIHTGPAGRTLAFKLPDVTEEERDQFYSNDIYAKFKDPDVMQYLVHRMIMAFKAYVPDNRLDNFTMNLASKRDLSMLPQEGRDWRQEFISADINIQEWFDEDILPFVETNRPLHIEVLYQLYLANVRKKSRSGLDDKYAYKIERFEKNIIPLFLDNGYTLNYTVGASVDKRKQNAKPRRTVKSPERVGINWKAYEESNVIPQKLMNETEMPTLFGKKVTGWFELEGGPE